MAQADTKMDTGEDKEKEEEVVEEEEEDLPEEEDVDQDSLLTIATYKYLLGLEERHLPADTPKSEVIRRMKDQIMEDEMAPYMKMLVDASLLPDDPSVYKTLCAKNDAEIKRLDKAAEDAKENQGDSEVREMKLAKAEYLKKIGAKEEAVVAYDDTLSVTLGTGEKIDIVFSKLRMGLALSDLALVKKELDVAKEMVERGGDWERRNLCGVYESAYFLAIRDFSAAAKLLNKAVSTFTCYKLFSYNQFAFYTVLVSAMSLDRVTLKKDIVNNSELLAVVNELPHLYSLVSSLYSCQYKEFFASLANISTHITRDMYLGPHIGYFLREIRLVAYSQFLESYKSVTLSNMASSFGVSVSFLDGELSRFIAGGRLNSKIDRVNGIVETNRPNKKSGQYNDVIKNGDLLLNKIQRLAKVVNY